MMPGARGAAPPRAALPRGTAIRGVASETDLRAGFGLRDHVIVDTSSGAVYAAAAGRRDHDVQMRQTTAAALVTAGVISVLVFPSVAIIVRRPGPRGVSAEPAVAEPGLELA